MSALEITGGGGTTVSASVAVPLPPAFEAVMETLRDPMVVVLPLITPVEVLTLNPDGRLLAAKLVGLLVAVIV
jgi:hypothetical protein